MLELAKPVIWRRGAGSRGVVTVNIEALEFSGVDSKCVTYIETLATCTAVGNPIEVSAWTAAYDSKTDKNQYCGMGSA